MISAPIELLNDTLRGKVLAEGAHTHTQADGHLHTERKSLVKEASTNNPLECTQIGVLSSEGNNWRR